MILGIIPARGGSKRLPGKNLKLLAGKSLLERTIEQAKQVLPNTIVSTEDTDITLEALRLGVHVLNRPKSLSTDEATSIDVVQHVLDVYQGFDWFCLLQVTSPLRSVEDIHNCLELAIKCDSPVFSTYEGKPNGAVYVGKFWKWNRLFLDGIKYEMPWERSIDIDDQHDFDEAEAILGNQIDTR